MNTDKDEDIKEEDEICATCGGTGEIAIDEDDGEGHSAAGVGSAPCPDCTPEPSEPEEVEMV